MRWIKGQWDTNKRDILVNPEYITCVDLDNRLLWADDCVVAVRFKDDQLPALAKLAGIPLTEVKGLADDKPTDKGKEKK